MKNLLSAVVPALALLLMFSLMSYSAEDAPASTTDYWESSVNVDSLATTSARWPKSVRSGVPTITFQGEMDGLAASDLDTVVVTLYTSQFSDPDTDQWVTDTSVNILKAAEPTTVTLSNVGIKNVKLSFTSKDTVTNKVMYSLWFN